MTDQYYYTLGLFSSFRNLVHGFSSRQMGNMSISRNPEFCTITNRIQFANQLGIDPNLIVQAKLSHSSNIAVVSKRETHPISEEMGESPEKLYRFPSIQREFDCIGDINSGYDCLITSTPGVSLMILTADCAPVLLYDPMKKVIALVHVGLLGTLNNILSCTFDVLSDLFHIKTTDLYLGIGPAISDCCYNLNNSGLWNKYLVNTFAEDYPDKRTLLVEKKDGVYIDLCDSIVQEAVKNGVNTDKIDIVDICVACSDIFFSNYATKGVEEKKKLGRFASIFGIKPDT